MRIPPGNRLGFWAASLVAILNVWFYLAFIPAQPILTASWPGMPAYAASFRPVPFLAWIIPAFFLGPVVLTMITCLHAWTAEERQTWSLLALVFAAVYAAVLTPFYYIQMTVVPYHLAQGTTEGLSLWLFAYYYPHNLFGAMEAVGWGLFGVSCLFAAQVFRGGKLQQWVRWTFVGLGVSVLGLFINPLFPLPSILGYLDGLTGLVLGLLAPGLLAVLLRRSESPASLKE